MENYEEAIVYPNGYKPNQCPACGRAYNSHPHEIRTAHHILPQRFFGRNNKGGLVILCQDCHTELDTQYVPSGVCLVPSEYVSIINSFFYFKSGIVQQFI